MTALLIAVVAIGALSQRVTGMGFALVVSPILLLILDPLTVVILINVCGVATSSLVATRTWRDIDWNRFRQLGFTALVGIVPGTLILFVLPDSWLKIGIGVLLLISLLAVTTAQRPRQPFDGPVVRLTFGFAFGFISSSAGVGGPSMSVYAILGRWQQTSFAATMQPLSLTTASTSLLSKILIDSSSWPALEWWDWVGVGVGLLAGLALGELLAPRIRPGHARTAIIVIAFVGAAAAIAKGVSAL